MQPKTHDRERCNYVSRIPLNEAQLFAMFLQMFSLSSIAVCACNMKVWYTEKQYTRIIRSVRFTETIEPGDKTAVRFTRVSNNDVINKNTVVRFTWLQPRFQNSFETFETTPGNSS